MDKQSKRPQLDIEKKLAAYKKRGEEVKPRVLFKAGIPQFLGKSKNEPYGEIPLTDDMTENDVIRIFRAHKKERRAYLSQFGHSKRKYVTLKESRNHEWLTIVKQQGEKPDYTSIARDWSKTNQSKVAQMTIEYLWKNPISAVSDDLRIQIQDAHKKGRVMDSFVKEYMEGDWRSSLRTDIEEYVRQHLPPLIRSAVARYKL